MGAVEDLSPLIDRVYEVLCAGAGEHRTIPKGTFRQGPARTAPAELPRSAAAPALVAVEIDEIAAAPFDDFNEVGDRQVQRYVVLVRVVYPYAGGDYLSRGTDRTKGEDRDSLTRRAPQHQRLIRYALGWPANLARTTKGAETGLVSGLLTYERTPPFAWGKDTLVVTHRFVGEVEIAAPV